MVTLWGKLFRTSEVPCTSVRALLHVNPSLSLEGLVTCCLFLASLGGEGRIEKRPCPLYMYRKGWV